MNEAYRKISIVFELERSIKYLRLGLAEVQKIAPLNDFYDPVFIFLSGGLERLFKTMLCLNFLEIQARLPQRNEIWTNSTGHDILFLKSKVEKICIDTEHSLSSLDLQMIINDDFINKVSRTLSEFGKRSRYFDLDAILGVSQDFDSKNAWEKLEQEISIEIFGEEQYALLSQDHNKLEEIYSNSNINSYTTRKIFSLIDKTIRIRWFL